MYKKGDNLCVVHKGHPWAVKVIDVDVCLRKIKVHYVTFNDRHNEWVDFDSDRIVVEGAEKENGSVQEIENYIDQLVETSKRKRGDLGDDESSPDLRLSKRPSVHMDGSSMSTLPEAEQRSGPLPLYNPVLDEQAISLRSEVVQADLRCSLCGCAVEGGGIGCGHCDRVFHAHTSCLGVSNTAIGALLEAVDGSLSYKCCHCRCGAAAGQGDLVNGGGMNQILSIIGSLVAEVRALSAGRPSQEAPCIPQQSHGGVGLCAQGSPPGIGSPAASVSEDVRELYEREKRKSSIVIRGAGNIPVDQVQSVFDRICSHLGVGSVVLVGVVRVNPSLFRARIEDGQQRFRILGEARKLRHSQEFRSVYVQRDLTFRQRAEVMAKRGQGPTAPMAGGSDFAESGVAEAGGAQLQMEANPPPSITPGLGDGGAGVGVRGRGRGRPRGRGRGGADAWRGGRSVAGPSNPFNANHGPGRRSN